MASHLDDLLDQAINDIVGNISRHLHHFGQCCVRLNQAQAVSLCVYLEVSLLFAQLSAQVVGLAVNDLDDFPHSLVPLWLSREVILYLSQRILQMSV